MATATFRSELDDERRIFVHVHGSVTLKGYDRIIKKLRAKRAAYKRRITKARSK